MSSASRDELRVCIDARLVAGGPGGVEQVVLGLAAGLASFSAEGPETYTYLVYEDYLSQLKKYAGPYANYLTLPNPRPSKLAEAMRRFVPGSVARELTRMRRSMRRPGVVPPCPHPELDSFDVIHFPKQDGFQTRVPHIYHPHDLQHCYLPEHFSPWQVRDRDGRYRQLIDSAALVAVSCDWIKGDIISQYGIAPEKIAVVPLAPAVQAYPLPSALRGAEIRQTLGLPEAYLLYPAQTWPHKNHIRLLEALNDALAANPDLYLVCCGSQNASFGPIDDAIARLCLRDSVRFTGYVSEEVLLALYSGARAVVFPSLFEAAGGFGPVAEAWALGVPVAVSDVCGFRAEVADAALLFNPIDTKSISASISSIWDDVDLRSRLVTRGSAQVNDRSWPSTAKVFRAFYRNIAGYALSEEDERLVTDSMSRGEWS